MDQTFSVNKKIVILMDYKLFLEQHYLNFACIKSQTFMNEVPMHKSD